MDRRQEVGREKHGSVGKTKSIGAHCNTPLRRIPPYPHPSPNPEPRHEGVAEDVEARAVGCDLREQQMGWAGRQRKAGIGGQS